MENGETALGRGEALLLLNAFTLGGIPGKEVGPGSLAPVDWGVVSCMATMVRE